MWNDDPDSLPEMSPEVRKQARQQGLHPIHVLCNGTGARKNHAGGMSFWALAAFIPQLGDWITLEDGRMGLVERVVYRLVRSGNGQMATMVPSVGVVPIPPNRAGR